MLNHDQFANIRKVAKRQCKREGYIALDRWQPAIKRMMIHMFIDVPQFITLRNKIIKAAILNQRKSAKILSKLRRVR